MISFTHFLSKFLRFVAVGALICASVSIATAQPQTATPPNLTPTTVTLHWGARPGVSRYRLQVANDVSFGDIVLDRAVTSLEYRVNDLPVGKYFWRVAPVGTRLTQASAGVIEVRAAAANPAKELQPKPTPAPQSDVGPTTHGGWFAAIGNTSAPILAYLRSTSREDVVAVSRSRVFALDTASGVELWNVRLNTQSSVLPIAVRMGNGLENVVILSANAAAILDGRTGRALWQAKLPATVSSAIAVNGKVFAIDSSLQKLLIIDSVNGEVIAQAQLPQRAVGAPARMEIEPRSVMVAMEDGRIQVIDDAGKVVRSGSAESAATTPPLFVRSARGNFVLVGAKDGLTALDARDLRPLGRINLNGDTARGALAAVDVDGDRNPEVVMLTERGQVFIVKSDEGRTVWSADARHADRIAYADVNGDGALDLLMMGRDGTAFALSGRDGSLVWKEETTAIAANHAPGLRARSLVVVSGASGPLLITSDAGGSGLRAIAFSASTPR
jgi:outer membrane protein assembly factor BamB